MNETEALEKFRRTKYLKLGLCVVMDLVGMATFLIPGLGESIDLVWAPVAGLINIALFRGFTGIAAGAVTFVEEILPFTDWVPSFTLSWGYHYLIAGRRTLNHFKEKHNVLKQPRQ